MYLLPYMVMELLIFILYGTCLVNTHVCYTLIDPLRDSQKLFTLVSRASSLVLVTVFIFIFHLFCLSYLKLK